MKRKNLRIIGIEEGEETQVKGTENILNKIIEENIPNLMKEIVIKVQKAYRTLNRLDQKRKSLWHIIIKTANIQKKMKNIKIAREKKQAASEG